MKFANFFIADKKPTPEPIKKEPAKAGQQRPVANVISLFDDGEDGSTEDDIFKGLSIKKSERLVSS